jgi:chromosome segregation ATPase
MASGPVPSSEQLLDLLRRAAEELKVTREELAKVKAQAEADQATTEAARVRLQAQFDAEKAAREELLEKGGDERTAMVIPQKGKKAKESKPDKTAREKAEEDLALEKVNSDSLRQALEQAKRELDQEQQALAQLRQSLDVDRQQSLEAVEGNLVGSLQEVAELKEQLKNEQDRTTEAAEQVAQAISERDATKARLEAAEAAQQVAESQRQGLESGHQVALEEARQQQHQAEAVATQEREKHQATAQKLLGERQRVRDLETQAEELQKRLKELDAAAKAEAETHLRELTDQSVSREEHFIQLAAQLEASNNERYFVERKFEELHRELLVVLEQRDEARGRLAQIEVERARLEQAIAQRR